MKDLFIFMVSLSPVVGLRGLHSLKPDWSCRVIDDYLCL